MVKSELKRLLLVAVTAVSVCLSMLSHANDAGKVTFINYPDPHGVGYETVGELSYRYHGRVHSASTVAFYDARPSLSWPKGAQDIKVSHTFLPLSLTCIFDLDSSMKAKNELVFILTKDGHEKWFWDGHRIKKCG